MLAKIVKAVLWILLAVGGLWILFLIGDVFMAWWLYSWFFQRIHEGSGFPDLVTGAIAVWCMAAVLLALPTIVSSFVWRNSRKWVLLTASLVSLWFVGMYFISRPAPGHLFNPITGKAQFRYSRTPGGKIEIFPLGYAYHPRYGTKLEEVNSEIAKEYEKQREPVVAVPRPLPTPLPTRAPTSPQATTKQSYCFADSDNFPICTDAKDLKLKLGGPMAQLQLRTDCWSGWMGLPDDSSLFFVVEESGGSFYESLNRNGLRCRFYQEGVVVLREVIPNFDFRLRGDGVATITIQPNITRTTYVISSEETKIVFPKSWFTIDPEKPIIIRLATGEEFVELQDGRVFKDDKEVSGVGDNVPGSTVFVRARDRNEKPFTATVILTPKSK